MHQTFYVEVDEEISSVVEKLRKSLSMENYFVLTGRSLIAQSVVNLKLLKREAEKLQKKIVIVTQDEQIMKMAQRSGIEIKNTMGGIELAKNEENAIKPFAPVSKDENDKKNRLVKVGSEDFYGEKEIALEKEDTYKENKVKEEVDVLEERPETAVKGSATSKNLSDFKVVPAQQSRPQTSDITRKSFQKKEPYAESRRGEYDLKKSFEDFLDPEKEKKFEKVLTHKTENIFGEKQKTKVVREYTGGNKFFFMALVGVLILAGIGGYLYVPSAEVRVYLENQDRDISLDVEADVSKMELDTQGGFMPARIIEKESEIMLSYASTGTSGLSGQKSRGTLVIYNEYGNSPQPLVATTRFETEDGKIFRLVKGVSIPGMTTVEGETKPGAIEVEVIADEAGDSYNIIPSSFKIPGFKGGDKYDKIYAKSSKPMMGGGLSGDEIKTVSQADIDSAKEKTEKSIREKMENMAKSEIAGGETILSENSKIEISESLALASVGDVKDTFDYQIKAKGKFLVFSEDDIRKIATDRYTKENKKDFEVLIGDIVILYENTEADFEGGKTKLKMVTKVSAKPIFDADKFKKEIVSKNENAIKEILKDYPYMRNMEVLVSPEFINKLPRFSKRITIEEKAY